MSLIPASGTEYCGMSLLIHVLDTCFWHRILWDVITYPCPWYLLLAQNTVGCHYLSMSLIPASGTEYCGMSLLIHVLDTCIWHRILWDVITYPWPWYLLLAQNTVGCHYLSMSLIPASGTEYCGMSLLIHVLDTCIWHRILWDVITYPCPWYLLLAQNTVGCHYLSMSLIPASGTEYCGMSLLIHVLDTCIWHRILWDVITYPCPWYLHLAQNTVGCHYLSMSLIPASGTEYCGMSLLIHVLDTCFWHRILWDVITYPCPWYLLLAHKSSYDVLKWSVQPFKSLI